MHTVQSKNSLIVFLSTAAISSAVKLLNKDQNLDLVQIDAEDTSFE